MLGLFAVISISVAGRPELEGMSKAELIDRIYSLEAKLQPQRQKLWPELQKTPTMMWNGWLPTTRGLIPGMKNNETLYYAAVDRLVSSGLRDAGYDTIAATCMGWERDPVTKKLRANPKTWPRGFKNWVSYAHEKKIKICAYSDTGVLNCCGGAATSNGKPEPGMFGYEELDIATFAEWGVDHIAVDNCDSPNTTAQSVFEYQRVHDALLKVGHPMVFGIWNVGSGKPWSWAPYLGHYWRTGPDLGTKWEGRVVAKEGVTSSVDIMSVMYNYDLQQSIPSLDSISGPGSFALLDNLALGLPPGVPHKGDPGLSLVEASTHMAIWCIMSSPLIINYNIFAPDRGTVDPEVVKIVMHDEAIAINQDPLGKSAVRIDGAHSWQSLSPRLPLDLGKWHNGEQLAKPLANGDWAVLLFNRLPTTIDITLQMVDIGNTSQLCWHVRDIWNRTDLGRFNGTFVARGVPSHGNRFLRLSAGEVCPRPPPPPPCTPPANVSGGFTLHPQRGWYSVSGQQLVGPKGTMSITECAAACTARGGADKCDAFHVYLTPSRSCSLGDCYVHSLPLGKFIAGNPFAYTYDRTSVV